MDAFSIHGGRLEAAKAAYPAAPQPWIDLSTGINPYAYPADFAAVSRTRLPDPLHLAALEATAARAFGLTPACVLAVAGAEAGLRLLSAALKVDRVAVVEPTYSGHRLAWGAAGAAVTSIARDRLEEAAGRFDLVSLVNPNNPDGDAIDPETLRRTARGMGAGWLVVDEAFVETTPDDSLARRLGPDWPDGRLVALRSFGKFYGLPGVRLGFVTGHPAVIRGLRERLGDWPVSADAITAGRQAYADHAWGETMRSKLAGDAMRLDALLRSAGFDVVGGTALFRLAVSSDTATRFSRLAAAGVLTRPFAHDPTWLRVGLPAAADWPRFETVLKETRL